MTADTDACRCGHARDQHEHLHSRVYCGWCGPCTPDNPDGCDRPFLPRRPSPLRALLRRLIARRLP